MSVTNRRGEKVTLSRTGADLFWKRVHDHYAAEDPTKWKYLAMLSLYENAGWPLMQIGYAFQHHKGHVQRCIQQIKSELRNRFELDWDEESPLARDDVDYSESSKCWSESSMGMSHPMKPFASTPSPTVRESMD